MEKEGFNGTENTFSKSLFAQYLNEQLRIKFSLGSSKTTLKKIMDKRFKKKSLTNYRKYRINWSA